MKSLNVLLSIDGKAVAAQQNARLNRQARLADITDRIALEWEDYLAGTRAWTVTCDGAYVIDDEALDTLEQYFIEGKPLEVKITNESNLTYTGKAIITSFPIGATYNKDVSYSLTLQGKGALSKG